MTPPLLFPAFLRCDEAELALLGGLLLGPLLLFHWRVHGLLHPDCEFMEPTCGSERIRDAITQVVGLWTESPLFFEQSCDVARVPLQLRDVLEEVDDRDERSDAFVDVLHVDVDVLRGGCAFEGRVGDLSCGFGELRTGRLF